MERECHGNNVFLKADSLFHLKSKTNSIFKNDIDVEK